MSVLVVTGGRVFPVEFPAGSERVVGSGPGADIVLEEPKAAARHLSLRHRKEGLLEVVKLEGPGSLLNDVQLSGVSSARPGDLIDIGGSQLLVQGASGPAAPEFSLVSHLEFEHRLAGEVARSRAHQRPLALMLIRLPAVRRKDRAALLQALRAESRSTPGATWGDFGGEILELLLPEAGEPVLEALKDRLIATLGSRGERFGLGPALFPEDGGDPCALFESALARLLGSTAAGQDEAALLDPVMVRLAGIVEQVGRLEGPVLLEGAPGVGKAVLARALHRDAPFRALRCAVLSQVEMEAALAQASPTGTVLLKGLDELAPASQSLLASVLSRRSCPARVVGSAESFGALRPELARQLGSLRLKVPSLVDRPADIAPLAEHFLARGRKALERPALTLSAEARRALLAHHWPGNVRELRNAIERAALLCGGSNELGLDELPVRLVRSWAGREGGGKGGLRASMRSAEKEALLSALIATGWNVTAAAQRLGLPRRTVVYRMARVGLRRPAR